MKQEFEAAIAGVVKELFNLDVQVELSRPDEQFGDYATNVALQLAKQVGKAPREIAEELVVKCRENLHETVQDISVAGPGFLNFTLTDHALLESLKNTELPRNYADQKVVIETNNPNPLKDMHIGHAYNSILADTIANLLEAGQANLHRVSYHGDVGLHVGKSMWAILRFVDGDPEKLTQVHAAERPKFLSEKYAEGAKAYDENEQSKEEIEALAQQSFSLEDELYKQVYETCKAWSFEYFDEVFSAIGSKPIERRYMESEADKAGRETVQKHLGDVFEESEGAIIFKGEQYDLHTRVFVNSRGNTLYEARDLGLMQLKQAEYQPQASYIVTANEQKEYFKVVLKAAELALPELAGVTQNISTGMVKLSTGKMSSRTGNVVNIGWLFTEIEKALRERGSDDETIQDALIGALRYTMLKNRIGGDTIFDINEAISVEGNSGPYLQYAHARAKSILRKSEKQPIEELQELEADERSLVRKLSEYPETIEKAVAELMPHHIASYLYELSQVFNRFYEHNRVIGDAREAERLLLVKRYADTLQKGLSLLGITAPEKM